jgi:hypothetical protein
VPSYLSFLDNTAELEEEEDVGSGWISFLFCVCV